MSLREKDKWHLSARLNSQQFRIYQMVLVWKKRPYCTLNTSGSASWPSVSSQWTFLAKVKGASKARP